jgi:hypothetical protein
VDMSNVYPRARLTNERFPFPLPFSPPRAQLEVASGVDDYRKRTETAEGRIQRLEEENARLSRENDRYKDQVDGLTDRCTELERLLREERGSREDATDALARMKANFERVEDQLARCVAGWGPGRARRRRRRAQHANGNVGCSHPLPPSPFPLLPLLPAASASARPTPPPPARGP